VAAWVKKAIAGTCFAAFYLGGAVSGVVVMPLIALSSRDPARRQARAQRYLSGAFRLTLDVLRGGGLFDFDARSVDGSLPSGPVLIVANHPTTIDVLAILSVYRDASVVVKHKIWRNPLLHPVFRWCGHIDGGDGSMASNRRVLDEMRERLESGVPVVVFPEGTRSPPHGLGPLYKGVFSVASTTGTPILPVLITSNPPVLHKEQPWHVWPSNTVHYRVQPGELLSRPTASARTWSKVVDGWFRHRLGLS